MRPSVRIYRHRGYKWAVSEMDGIKKGNQTLIPTISSTSPFSPCGFEASQLLPDMFWSVSSAKNNEFWGLFLSLTFVQVFPDLHKKLSL